MTQTSAHDSQAKTGTTGRVDPRDVGGSSIGHFGFFRRTFKSSLWDDTLGALTDVFEGRKPRQASTPKGSWGIREEDVWSDLLRRGAKERLRAPTSPPMAPAAVQPSASCQRRIASSPGPLSEAPPSLAIADRPWRQNLLVRRTSGFSTWGMEVAKSAWARENAAAPVRRFDRLASGASGDEKTLEGA